MWFYRSVRISQRFQIALDWFAKDAHPKHECGPVTITDHDARSANPGPRWAYVLSLLRFTSISHICCMIGNYLMINILRCLCVCLCLLELGLMEGINIWHICK